MISSFRFQGENQNIVRFRFLDFARMKDRNANSRHEIALFVRAQVNRVVDEIGTGRRSSLASVTPFAAAP